MTIAKSFVTYATEYDQIRHFRMTAALKTCSWSLRNFSLNLNQIWTSLMMIRQPGNYEVWASARQETLELAKGELQLC